MYLLIIIIVIIVQAHYQDRGAETKFTTGSADNFHQLYFINLVSTMTLKTGRLSVGVGFNWAVVWVVRWHRYHAFFIIIGHGIRPPTRKI